MRGTGNPEKHVIHGARRKREERDKGAGSEVDWKLGVQLDLSENNYK